MTLPQDMEPAVASFLHTSILVHASLAKAMAFMLANKLTSRTLLGTQLVRLISAAYADDPVSPSPSWHYKQDSGPAHQVDFIPIKGNISRPHCQSCQDLRRE